MDTGKKKIAFHTLGCKLNFTETSTIARSFPGDLYERVPAGKKADIYIINTCSVTDAADKKCRQAIKKFIHQSPDAFIAVVGCYAQLKPEEISSIPGVDLVLGVSEKFDIAGYLAHHDKKKKAEVHSGETVPGEKFHSSYSAGDRTRSFLKVQDGCDYGCSYCTVPLARGKSRSPGIKEILDEAALIAGLGVKEIVLTGVNIGDYGKSRGSNFVSLLKELADVPGIERYRISSIEPNLLTDEIIDLCASGHKILPHFHIPLQSGCNRILSLMGRRYKRELFAERLARITRTIPLAGIGADVIAGFPGETDSDFEETLLFLQDLPLTYLHVFTFSERPGTKASLMPGKVRFEIKENRSKRLIALSHSKHNDFLERNIGSPADVLFEHTRSDGMITGYTGNYIRVEYPWHPSLAGAIRKVRLSGITGNNRMNIELIS